MYVLRFACTVYACYVAFPFVNICVFVVYFTLSAIFLPVRFSFRVCVMPSIPCWVWRVRYLSSGPHGPVVAWSFPGYDVGRPWELFLGLSAFFACDV